MSSEYRDNSMFVYIFVALKMAMWYDYAWQALIKYTLYVTKNVKFQSINIYNNYVTR